MNKKIWSKISIYIPVVFVLLIALCWPINVNACELLYVGEDSDLIQGADKKFPVVPLVIVILLLAAAVAAVIAVKRRRSH